MSENHQEGVSPDKLSRPEQEVASNCAAIIIRMNYEAVSRAVAALQPVVDAMPTPVESIQSQPQYAEPTASQTAADHTQPYAAMPAYQVADPAGSVSSEGASYDDFSPQANDAYLSALAQSDDASTTPAMTPDASSMAEEARRLAEEAFGPQTNGQAA